MKELPMTDLAAETVLQARAQICDVIHGRDPRLLVVAGPCSIHDPAAALDLGQRLLRVRDALSDALLLVMRVYFEKPRTTVGWKGLIKDPYLDGSHALHEGLRRARRLLLDLADRGLPAACEFLDPILPQYTADLVSWGAIGARTVESQVHRELASGLSMPVGFKNSTDGRVQVAIDAVRAAAQPHCFLGVTEQGLGAMVLTRGNPDCHIVLRGGEAGPNHDSASVQQAAAALAAAGLEPRLMVDASHGNSGRDHRRQPEVVRDLCAQLRAGQPALLGVMMECFLLEGRQALNAPGGLRYGQSITDGCMGWDTTQQLLFELAAAVRAGRMGRGA